MGDDPDSNDEDERPLPPLRGETSLPPPPEVPAEASPPRTARPAEPSPWTPAAASWPLTPPTAGDPGPSQVPPDLGQPEPVQSRSRAGARPGGRIVLGLIAVVAAAVGILGLVALPYYGGERVFGALGADPTARELAGGDRRLALVAHGPLLVLVLGVALLADRWWRPVAVVLLITSPWWAWSPISVVIANGSRPGPRPGSGAWALFASAMGALLVLVGTGLRWRALDRRGPATDGGGTANVAAAWPSCLFALLGAALLTRSWFLPFVTTRLDEFSLSSTDQGLQEVPALLRWEDRDSVGFWLHYGPFVMPLVVLGAIAVVLAFASGRRFARIDRSLVWGSMAAGLVLEQLLRALVVGRFVVGAARSVPGESMIEVRLTSPGVAWLLASAGAFVVAAWLAANEPPAAPRRAATDQATLTPLRPDARWTGRA